jgi:hypothetical protein
MKVKRVGLLVSLALLIVCSLSPAQLRAQGGSTAGIHVFYIDQYYNVDLLFQNGSTWSDLPAGNYAAAPLAESGSALASTAIENGGFSGEVAVYETTGNEIDAIFWNGSAWTASSPSGAALGAPLAASDSGLAAYLTNQYNVFYITDANYVGWLYQTSSNPGGAWAYINLNTTAGALSLPAAAGSPLAVYQASDGGLYVEYLSEVSGNLHVISLWRNGSGGAWSYADLTAITGAPAAISGSALAAYVDGGEQNVDYVTANHHVDTLYYSGGWHYADLTSITGALPVAAGSALTAYVDGGAQYVDFVTTTPNDVGTLWYTSSWHFSNLTSATGGSQAYPSGLTAVVDRSGYQYVDYLSGSTAPDVWLLEYTTGWNNYNLTGISGYAAGAISGSALSSNLY